MNYIKRYELANIKVKVLSMILNLEAEDYTDSTKLKHDLEELLSLVEEAEK